MDMFSVPPFRRWASLSLWLLYLIILFGSGSGSGSSSSSSSSRSSIMVRSASVGSLRGFDEMDGSERLAREAGSSCLSASSPSSSQEEEGAWSSPACPLSLLLNPVEPKAAPYKRKHESSHSDRSEQERPAPPAPGFLAYEARGDQRIDPALRSAPSEVAESTGLIRESYPYANGQLSDADKIAMAISLNFRSDTLAREALIEGNQGSSWRHEDLNADGNGNVVPSVLSQAPKKFGVIRNDAKTIRRVADSRRTIPASDYLESDQRRPLYDTEKKVWVCPAALCEYKSRARVDVVEHLDEHHLRATCEVCGKAFDRHYFLGHMRRHVEYYDLPKGQKCHHCQFGFWTSRDVEAHKTLPYHLGKVREERALLRERSKIVQNRL